MSPDAAALLPAFVATRARLLPEVIDLSSILSASGAGGLVASVVAAALHFPPDRLARLVVFGNLVGAAAGIVLLGLAATGVLS